MMNVRTHDDRSLRCCGVSQTDWEVKRIKDVALVFNGATPASSNEDFWEGTINWITPEDISQNIFITKSKRRITELGYKSCGTSLVPPNSIILTTRAPIGNLAITKIEVCTNQV